MLQARRDNQPNMFCAVTAGWKLLGAVARALEEIEVLDGLCFGPALQLLMHIMCRMYTPGQIYIFKLYTDCI